MAREASINKPIYIFRKTCNIKRLIWITHETQCELKMSTTAVLHYLNDLLTNI